MDIIPLGHSSFRIRGKAVTIVTDPFDSTMVGLPFPKHVNADIVTVSHDHNDHNAVSVIEGNPYVVKGPGEYEIKGVEIIGIPSFHDEIKGKDRGTNTMYHMIVDNVNIVHLGDLGTNLSAADVDNLDGVDILMVPVGGEVTLGPAEAARIISEIEPSIVIPMHYGQTKKNQKIYGSLSPVSVFLKAMGKEDVTAISKLSVTKDKLPSELTVVVLE